MCEEIAAASAMTRADVLAVLDQLSEQMIKHLVRGDKVKLDGIGTFYLTAKATGNGVDSEKEVSPQQINKVMVRFTAEKQPSMGGVKAHIPTLAASNIEWVRVPIKGSVDAAKSGENSGGNSGNSGNTGGETGGNTPTGDDEP